MARSIETHADLLAAYAEARRSVIHEWSGSIAADIHELAEACARYAHAHGIEAPDAELFAPYLDADYLG